MFKNKKSRTILITVVVILALSVTVFAKQATETIDVIYDNIKILIDGVEYTAQDANGNVIEPFIYNGTTYLPVRGIANAFDKDVDWESQTSTVILGSKNYDWLDAIGYADYKYTGIGNSFSAMPNNTEMSDGLKFNRGLIFTLYDYLGNTGGTVENKDGTFECTESVSYILNNNYTSFTGTISHKESGNTRVGNSVVKIYGDEKLLYTSPIVSYGMKSADFNISVENVKLLKIDIEFLNTTGTTGVSNTKWSYPCIAEARLLKK